jgi:hypothetical protein
VYEIFFISQEMRTLRRCEVSRLAPTNVTQSNKTAITMMMMIIIIIIILNKFPIAENKIN